MLSREGLWRRLSGDGFWGLPWAMAAACAVPWGVPEAWNGRMPLLALAAGWVLVLGLAPLARYRRWAWLPMLLALTWGTVGNLGRQARWEAALPSGFQPVQGLLASPWRVRGRTRVCTLRVQAPAALRGVELPLSLPAGGTRPPAPGTVVAFRGELCPVDPGPRFLPERPLWRARSGGAPRRVHLASALLLEAQGPARPSPLLALRCFVQSRFEALPLPPGTARDCWGALTLGLPPARDEAFSAFAESGTIHTLVVSGLQVTLVMGGLEAFWRRLVARGKRGSVLVAMAGGLLYCSVVGFSAPVWRGLLMGFAWALGKGSGWKLPPVLTLHGALLLWLFTHPAAGVEPGFLLAWLALLGLVWGSEPLAGLVSPLLRRWALPFAQVLAPWLSTLPLLALLHGGVPLWGVPANLVLLPVAAVLAPLGLVLLLVPVPGGVAALGALLGWAGETLVPCFARVVPLATAVLWPWVALLLGWILLAQLQADFQRTRWLTALLLGGSLTLLATGGTGRAVRTLTVEALDIGQGDALLLRVPQGDATLIDTGPDPRAARRIVRVLSRRGVREPVHLVLSHPHLDHAGGWATLARLWPLASTSRPPLAGNARVWDPYAPPGAEGKVGSLTRGCAWARGSAAFSVRWPPKALAVRDLNMISAVLRVRWQDRELWFMGDALALQEQDLLTLGDPGGGGRARLLKAGHHGSRSASEPAWVQALEPDLALVPAGSRNAFDHPHPEAMAALAATGAHVFVTGATGGVRVEARPGGWRVETGRGARLVLASPLLERAAGLERRHEGQADARVVGLPLGVGPGSHPVGHSQGRATRDARRLAGGENARQFQVFGWGAGSQALGSFQGLGNAGRDRHRMDREGGGGPGGRPPDHFDGRTVGAALQEVQGDRQGLGGAEEVPDAQTDVIGAAGAHEEHPDRVQLREPTGRGHRCREGPDPRATHPPAWGRLPVQARQLGRESGQEERRACGHGVTADLSGARSPDPSASV